MKRINIIFLFAFFIFHFSFLFPLKSEAQQTGKSFRVETKKKVFLEVRFLLYLPEGYNAKGEMRWPLVVFLHGDGEKGDWLELVKKNGPPMLVNHGESFPFILVSPQCPEEQDWSIEVLDMLLTEMAGHYLIDEDRVYITGLSSGGQATWDLAIAYPKRFAAIVPVCGSADPNYAAKIKKVPVWAFHGEDDPIVPLQDELKMIEALQALGAPAKITVLPDTDHDAWTFAYSSEDMWKWLLEQRRVSR